MAEAAVSPGRHGRDCAEPALKGKIRRFLLSCEKGSLRWPFSRGGAIRRKKSRKDHDPSDFSYGLMILLMLSCIGSLFFLLYYSQIQLTHLLAPFPFRRPVIPLTVALLRLVPFPLAGMKNSLRILCHFHLRIVLQLQIADAGHGLPGLFEGVEGGQTEVPLAAGAKARARRAHNAAFVQQKVEELPAGHAAGYL